jgi:hypothetical protein
MSRESFVAAGSITTTRGILFWRFVFFTAAILPKSNPVVKRLVRKTNKNHADGKIAPREADRV